MKKVLLLMLLSATAVGASAQNDKGQLNTQKEQDSSKDKHPDGFMLKDGKMVVVKNGKIAPMEQEYTLSNGTRILQNGNYIKNDGTELHFREGDHMDMMGRFIAMNESGPAKKSGEYKSGDDRNKPQVRDTVR